MALVDYSSDSESEEAEDVKPSAGKPAAAETAAGRPSLPPLPASFHDLYAATVRTSTRDDPSLHQGRTRQIPHVSGNWPSHIYVEWFPAPEQCELLGVLLADLQSELGQGDDLHTFLTSDLGAPLPLHISLSRPFVLTTEEKDDFLRRLTVAIEERAAVTRFVVRPRALSWHRSPDSNRAFLVLRVQEEDDGRNPRLAALLSRCNDLVRSFDQPVLYVSEHGNQAAVPGVAGGDGESQKSKRDDGGSGHVLDDKFHVSIAWSFAQVIEDLRSRTAGVYERPRFRNGVGAMEIPVGPVKVKIGNVVTSLTLPERRQRRFGAGALFGI